MWNVIFTSLSSLSCNNTVYSCMCWLSRFRFAWSVNLCMCDTIKIKIYSNISAYIHTHIHTHKHLSSERGCIYVITCWFCTSCDCCCWLIGWYCGWICCCCCCCWYSTGSTAKEVSGGGGQATRFKPLFMEINNKY